MMQANTFAAYTQALYEFWSSFLYNGEYLPAYISGHVPPDKEDHFPYWTYEVKHGEFGSTAIVTAFLWFQQSMEPTAPSAWSHIADVMSMVENAIPPAGRWITFAGGGVLLRRNGPNFISSYDPAQDSDGNVIESPIRGGRVSYTIQFFMK